MEAHPLLDRRARRRPRPGRRPRPARVLVLDRDVAHALGLDQDRVVQRPERRRRRGRSPARRPCRSFSRAKPITLETSSALSTNATAARLLVGRQVPGLARLVPVGIAGVATRPRIESPEKSAMPARTLRQSAAAIRQDRSQLGRVRRRVDRNRGDPVEGDPGEQARRRSPAMPAITSAARGSTASESQPESGPPIGVEPRKTIE